MDDQCAVARPQGCHVGRDNVKLVEGEGGNI